MANSYTTISNNQQLIDLCLEIKNEKIIALDTEFVRTTTYYPKLSLLQICCDKTKSFIIDCFCVTNLEPIFEIIYNPKITKVMHGCKQDMEIFYFHNHKFPKNIFDTQIALGALGYKHDTSYDQMVLALCNILIDKNIHYKSWVKRPLTKAHLDYAANDVIYLYQCFFKIVELLKKESKLSWITDAFEDLRDINNYNKKQSKDLQKIISIIKDKNMISIANSIISWREDVAKKYNLIRNNVLTIKHIIKLLKKQLDPKDLPILKTITLSEIKSLEDFLEKKTSVPLPREEKYHLTSPADVQLLKTLKILLQSSAKENNIYSGLIATPQDLSELILNNSPNSKLLNTWRYNVFGKQAIEIINQNKQLIDNPIKD